MTVDSRAELESRFSRLHINQRIHDVPPHEVYAVRVDGRRAVLKRNTGPTGTAGAEGRVIEFVGNCTSVPVPEVLLIEQDCFIAEWDERAPSPDGDCGADPTWARAAGKGLARLHEESARSIDTFGTFRWSPDGLEIDERDAWHDAVRDYIEQRRRTLTEADYADILGRVATFFEQHPAAFTGTGGPVCCHGWATPEHVAVDNGAIACLVDFEHAIAAPAEFDFWRTVFPVFGADGQGPSYTAFRDGYESVRALPDGLHRRKPLYALLNGAYFLESLYVQDQHGPAETARRAEQLRTRIDDILTDLR